ncbi:MAG: major capsid protein [Arizlama microvirus]|nr:MAG: major capsid protein [Arizlama microvirus]
MSDGPMAQPGRNNAFHNVPAEHTPTNLFSLDHTKHLTADMGKIMPVCLLECVPGDVYEIGADMLIRTQALLAPVMDSAKASIHFFFVPNRLTWPKIDTSGNDWETFITGGPTGLSAPTMPTWNVSSGKHGEGSLWDYFGLPTWAAANNFTTAYPDAIAPTALPLRAYNITINEYYRDETLQTELAMTNEDLFNRNWTKDYFTSALPSQQRGTSPALPLTGTSAATWTAANIGVPGGTFQSVGTSNTLAGNNKLGPNAAGVPADNALGAFNANTVNLAVGQSVNISQLRLAIATQQLLEKTMVGGARYTEYLQTIYGTHPRDDTLNRPQYIGGTMQPVIFSEVVQMSSSNTQPTPQGNLAGHGISVGQNYVGKYRAMEFGYIIGLLSVMPEPSYSQGIPKMWTRPTRYDHYNPYFANLSEQAVLNQELYLAGDGANQTIFGYQARYNEMRYERSTVHGVLRSTLDYWTFTRKFAARPTLNSAFIQLTDAEVTTLKRVTPVTSQPWLIIQVGNRIRRRAPLPVYATPGLTKV